MSSHRKAAQLSWNLLKTCATNPRGLRYVCGVSLWATEQVVDRRCDISRLPAISLEDLPPEGEPLKIELVVFPNTRSSISLTEFLGLVLLMKKAKAKNVFEFGTYKGVSISQLALNTPREGNICTLDLPDDSAKATRFAITDPQDLQIAVEKGKGTLVPTELRSRIQFLQQDSAAFDESPYAGKMDFVFVDGAHNAAYVKNDSEKGWRMLRSGGIIAWHDCRVQDPEVVEYLLNSSFAPCHITGSTLAFAVKP